MVGGYRIFGSELSPYSVKVRSYFRYKGLAHEWILRGPANMAEFKRHAKLPLIPLVVTPDGDGLQDSTPIIERFEAAHPTPSIHPDDPALAFLSALIEEYGEEWLNKPMFHYRWFYEPDQQATAARIARAHLAGGTGASSDEAGGDEAALRQATAAVIARMVPRLGFVGSSPETKDQIEDAFVQLLAILEPHLARRAYLFGSRPAFGDFGLFAQLHQCSTEPTAGALMAARAPNTLAWIARMLAPTAGGRFEDWSALAPTLEPLLADQVAGLYLPWATANAAALAAGEASFSVALKGSTFGQQTQKYHARSLAALKQRYAAVTDRTRLDPILARTGCLDWLAV